jgi:hypothetical protein
MVSPEMSTVPTLTPDSSRPCCPLGLHRWRATWSAGEFVCLRCGRRALCLSCVYVLPRLPFVTLHYCDRHRTAEQSPAAVEQEGGQR